MAYHVDWCTLAGVVVAAFLLVGCQTSSEVPGSQPALRQRSDAGFEKLRQEEQQRKHSEQPQEYRTEPTQATSPVAQPSELQPRPSDSPYLKATGYGDLSKGQLICQRVADTAARAELAKLIRVTIKEHAIDRVRERTGQPIEQDIEVIREELVNELLLDVRIVDRNVDKPAGTCSSTAVMPKSHLTSKEAENQAPNAQAPER